MNTFKLAWRSGKRYKLRRQFDEQFFALGEPGLDLIVDDLPNRTPQQHDVRDKPPRRGSGCGSLGVQRDKSEASMLEQESARPVLQNVASTDA